eukprot:745094_1
MNKLLIAFCFFFFVQFIIAFHPYFEVLIQFFCCTFHHLLILIHICAFFETVAHSSSCVSFRHRFSFCSVLINPCTVSFDSLSSFRCVFICISCCAFPILFILALFYPFASNDHVFLSSFDA